MVQCSQSIFINKYPDPHSIYPLPTDQAELDRLDKEHELVKELFNWYAEFTQSQWLQITLTLTIIFKSMYRSPVESLLMKGIKVLDVG
jgi:hypothetical protein